VAATESRSTEPWTQHGAIVAAACALPGVALAQGAPTEGLIALKYLHYKDSQPSLDRVTVRSPSLYALLPVGANWSVEGAFVVDDTSGATPRYHSSVSSASRHDDRRTAGDLKVTRYFRRTAVGLGVAHSTEDDYRSNAVSTDVRVASEDNNTTVAFGAGYTDDEINPTERPVRDERKRVVEALIGITQVLSSDDIVKLNVTHSRGRGFFTDPYKEPDRRPRERDTTAVLLAHNHHFSATDGTLRSSYRWYNDTFEVKAYTLGFEYVQPLGSGFSVMPALRYHTQSAAFFYYDPVYDPVLGEPFPPGFQSNPNRFLSGDHRLSAFGAFTAGLKVAQQFARDWTVDLRYDYYEQRGEWRAGGKGSTGLEPFRAHFVQAGIAKRF